MRYSRIWDRDGAALGSILVEASLECDVPEEMRHGIEIERRRTVSKDVIDDVPQREHNGTTGLG